MIPLPFDDLLEEVQELREGEWVDIDERLAVQELLRRYDGASVTELRDAIAALLARSAEEASRIAEAFDRRYRSARPVRLEPAHDTASAEDDVQPKSSAPRSTSNRKSLRPPWILAAIATLALIWGVASIIKPLLPDPVGGAGPTAAGGSNANPPAPLPEPILEPAPPSLWPWPPPTASLWAAGATYGLALLYFGFREARRGLSKWRSRRWKEFVKLEGPRDYRVDTTFEQPLRQHAFEVMTGALEALAGKLSQSPRIDVPETVRLTANRAAVSIAYEPSNSAGRLLVLRDIGQPMLQWRVKVDRLLADLQRETVVDVLYFDQDPTLVSPTPDRRGRPLHEWTAHCAGLPLLMLTDGRFLEQPHVTGTFLRRAFEPWPLRVVLHPVEQQELWPALLRARDAVIPAFPMSHAGYRALLRWLPTRARDARARFQPAATALWPGDVLRLRAMLSFFPQPSFELAELLRTELMPSTPDSVLLTLDPVLLPVEGSTEVADARAWLGAWFKHNPAEAQKYEAFWRRHVTEPALGSAAHQRYMRDRAVMRLHLSPDVAADEGLQEMARAFAGSPVADDWHQELARFERTHAAEPNIKQQLSQLRREVDVAAVVTSAGRKPARWAVPTRWLALAAMLSAVVAMLLGNYATPQFDILSVDIDPALPGDRPCDAGSDRCGGLECRNLQVDSQNCGACGQVCQEPGACIGGKCERCAGTAGLVACADQCVDLRTDVQNCGSCGARCAVDNATRKCVDGACTALVCAGGYASCDGKAASGCEVNLLSDELNCGRCGNRCPKASRGKSGCRAGKCFSDAPPQVCKPGWADCDGNSGNGCEAALTLATSCGSCTNQCRRSEICQGRKCVVPNPFCEPACDVSAESCRARCGGEPAKKGGTLEHRSGNVFGQDAAPAAGPRAAAPAPAPVDPMFPASPVLQTSPCHITCEQARTKCLERCRDGAGE